MAAQAGLCLAWSESPEDTFCRVVAQIIEEYGKLLEGREISDKYGECIDN